MTVSIVCAKPTALSVPSLLVGEGQGGGSPTTGPIALDKIPFRQIPSHRLALPFPLRGGQPAAFAASFFKARRSKTSAIGGGPHGQYRPEPPPSLTLPHKGGGNAVCGWREGGSPNDHAASTSETLPA